MENQIIVSEKSLELDDDSKEIKKVQNVTISR